MYHSLQAQADVAHTGTSDPNLIEATMEQTGVDEVTSMERMRRNCGSPPDGRCRRGNRQNHHADCPCRVPHRLVGDDLLPADIARYADDIRPVAMGVSLLPKWEGSWAKWLTRYLTVHFYGAMLYFVGFYACCSFDIVLCIQVENLTAITASEQTMAAYLQNSFFSPPVI